MELIEKYIYAVTSKLPEKQREDIAKELETLISDMMEELPKSENETENIKRVLEKLGNPSILANNYRENKRCLVGPQNFTKYIFVLKIVLMAVFFAVTIGTLINGIFIHEGNIVDIVSEYFQSVIFGLLQGFTWVTIIFAILEYNGVDLNEKSEGWDIEKLPSLPNKKAMISRVGSIVGIVFISIFAIIFYNFPEIIAIYIEKNGEYKIISFFDLNYYNNVRIFILGMFIVGIVREMLKLIYGRWTISLAIYYTLLTITSMVLFIIFFSNPQIWNSNFVYEFSKHLGIDLNFKIDKALIINIVIKIVVLVNLIDIILVVYKGIKYDFMTKENK